VIKKRCSQCGKVFLVATSDDLADHFIRRDKTKGNFRSECKVCSSISYEDRRDAGKIKKISDTQKWDRKFKDENGIAFTTFKNRLQNAYLVYSAKYWTLSEVPENQRKKVIKLIRDKKYESIEKR